MKAMACSRYGCVNQLSERYSPIYGPICKTCFDELVDLGGQVDIASFLDSEASDDARAKRRKESMRYFNQVFRKAVF